MNLKKPVMLLVALMISISAVILSRCTESSGVLKLGPDAYTISASAPPGRGGSAEAQRIALSGANEFCAKGGKEIHVIELKVSAYNADLIFRCVDKGVPKFEQP